MLPNNWNKWIIQNLLQGVVATQLLQTLLDNGFNFEDCKKALGSNLPANCDFFKNRDFYRKVASPGLYANLGRFDACELEQDRAQLIQIRHFLTKQECEDIMSLARLKLRPSTITQVKGYEDVRTSTTCDLSYVEDGLVQTLDDKIRQTLGLEITNGEPIQAQHYAVGQQFKAHTDYFEPGTHEYLQYAKARGQRTWTFMIYLNEGCEGGETEFPQLGLSFSPKQGRALIWNNLSATGHPNPATLHQSHAIISGEKMVITKWFRDQ